MTKITQPRQLVRIFSVAAGVAILLSSFQNCSPMQNSSPDPVVNASTGNPNPTPSPTMTAAPPPAYIASVFANQSAAAGSFNSWLIGINNSLATGPFEYQYTATESAFTACSPTATCTTSVKFTKSPNDGNISVDMNNGRVRVRIQNNECVQSASTITITAQLVDKNAAGATISTPSATNSKTYVVSYNNVCPSESAVAPTDSQLASQFGSQIAVDGTHAVVSAPVYTDVGTSRSGVGEAYVYNQSGTTWSQGQQLLPPAAPSGSSISAVAIKGNYLVLGATGSVGTSATGAVYIYQLSGTTWTLVSTLTTPAAVTTPANNIAYFGRSVAIIGTDTIAVGAIGANSQINSSVSSGQVFIYTHSGAAWNLAQTIEAETPVTNGYFGASMAASGNLLVVGAPMKTTAESKTALGSVAILNASTVPLTLVKTVTAPTAAQVSVLQFGASVATNGSTVVVGAPFYDSAGGTNVNGTAFTYSSTGVFQKQLTDTVNGETSTGDHLGTAVAVTAGGDVYVSKPGASNNQTLYGEVLKYTGGNTLSYRVAARTANRAPKFLFGNSLAVSSNTLAAGSPGAAGPGGSGSGMGFFIGLP